MEREIGEPAKRRIAVKLQYDGTGFHGWQLQNDLRTVQGEVEKALEILLKEKIRVTASGRTDTGVHALGQVLHFDSVSDIDLSRLCIGINGIMQRDISVLNAYYVPETFHARFSAVEREYEYRIYNHPLRSPFMRYRALWVSYSLDRDRLDKILQVLVGEFDFASFCKKISAEQGTVRRITSIRTTGRGDYIMINIRGNAFLHNMIRIIIGTALRIYREKGGPEQMLEILEQRDRDFSGETASAYGLYLKKIKYEPDLESMESAFPINFI